MRTLKFIVTGTLFIAAVQLSAQVGVFRIDTARTILRDPQGNVIGSSSSFLFRMEGNMEGSFESRHDKLKSQKIAYFSNNIELTVKEAEKFWPLYNEYVEKNEAVIRGRRQALRRISDMDDMDNGKDMKTQLDIYTTSFTKEEALFQEYYKKFQEILPIQKVGRLYITEEQFKRLLLQSIRRE
ncbi:MAG: hypothetical protein LBT48_05690 [Prevotellaceae bacterium]|jgi:hypothetical protein|nr:hypothetical protein [Prevotellaceae bacterium]